MARTTIPVQVLDTPGGEAVTFVAADDVNDMAFDNTGEELVLVRTQATSGVTLDLPSVACSHGRLANVPPSVIGAAALRTYGPFTPVSAWGDGASQGHLDFSALTGTVEVAVVRKRTG